MRENQKEEDTLSHLIPSAKAMVMFLHLSKLYFLGCFYSRAKLQNSIENIELAKAKFYY